MTGTRQFHEIFITGDALYCWQRILLHGSIPKAHGYHSALVIPVRVRRSISWPCPFSGRFLPKLQGRAIARPFSFSGRSGTDQIRRASASRPPAPIIRPPVRRFSDFAADTVVSFAASRSRFRPADVASVEETVAHQMYLDVGAELGLLGLAAFVAALGYAIRGALRATRLAPEDRTLARAVLIGFAGTLVAACFLSEQLYLPVWLLVALGVALDPVRPSGRGWW